MKRNVKFDYEKRANVIHRELIANRDAVNLLLVAFGYPEIPAKPLEKTKVVPYKDQ